MFRRELYWEDATCFKHKCWMCVLYYIYSNDEQWAMSVERTSFLTAFYIFNCCSPLCVFRFLFDLTFIFQQQRVSERASLCVPTPYDRIIRTHSSVYLYGYTVTMILIRMKQRKKKLLACAYEASTRTHSNQCGRSLLLLLYEQQIKHAYRRLWCG